jgi:hypothetical protein
VPEGKPVPIWGEGGYKIVAWTWVSDEDYAHAKQFRWYMADGYVMRTLKLPDGGKTSIPMHRDLMGLENGDTREVDHEDRDRLNNRRSNLRIVERWENERNHAREPHYSRKVGVTLDKARGKWKAQASLDGEYVYLGLYETEEAAIIARFRWEWENDRLHADDYALLRELMERGVVPSDIPLSVPSTQSKPGRNP